MISIRHLGPIVIAMGFISSYWAIAAGAADLPDNIPSLYGYNHGANNGVFSNDQYAYLLDGFCNDGNQSPRDGSLSAQDYATTIYNLRYSKYRNEAERLDLNAEIDELIKCAHKTGKLRVIINYQFYESPNQHKHKCETTGEPIPDAGGFCPDDENGNPGYEPANLADAKAAFDMLLGVDGPSELTAEKRFEGSGYLVVAGIVLAEENTTHDFIPSEADPEVYVRVPNLRSTLLHELYGSLKSDYGQQFPKFFQWYSGSNVANYPGSAEYWPVIGADGWVFDQYSMDVIGDDGLVRSSTYEEFVHNLHALGKPLFGIVWASPLRYFRGGAGQGTNHDFWGDEVYQGDTGGWRTLYAQAAINQFYQVHTLYYTFTQDIRPAADQDDLLNHDVHMTLKSLPSQCGVEMFRYLLDVTFPYEFENDLNYHNGFGNPFELPTTRPDWIVAAPVSCEYDYQGGGLPADNDNCYLTQNPGQVDSDNDGYGNACDADFNDDCVVNYTDYTALIQNYGVTEAGEYDLNEDGLVNFQDVNVFSELFLGEPGPSACINGCTVCN